MAAPPIDALPSRRDVDKLGAMPRPSIANVLFVCSQNKLRSPTAEQIYASRRDLEVQSAGTNNDAENPLTAELVEWADVIVVMEKMHRTKIQKRFRAALKCKRMICLDIPDNYAFMEPVLVDLLTTRLARHFPER